MPAVWNVLTDFTLTAVPLFIFRGEILLISGVSNRIYSALAPLFQRFPGKLLLANEALKIDAFADVLDVNLTGVMRLCNAFLPQLKHSQGNIISTASLASFIGVPRAVGYGAGKTGVTELTKSLAITWAPHGIRVNAIAPGYVGAARIVGAASFWEHGTHRKPIGDVPSSGCRSVRAR